MSTEQHEALIPAPLSRTDIARLWREVSGATRMTPGEEEFARRVERAALEVQRALIVQMAEALEVISANDEYETEYDGRMYTKCHSCRYDELKAAYQDELKGHQDDCEYIAARTVLAAATQYLKGPKT